MPITYKNYAYDSDNGKTYKLRMSTDKGTLSGLTELQANQVATTPYFPRWSRPRGVWAVNPTNKKTMFLPCGKTSTVYNSPQSQTFTYGGASYTRTGRQGEEMRATEQ